MKKINKIVLLVLMFAMSMNVIPMTHNVYANQNEEHRLPEKDEKYYTVSFHYQAGDDHYKNLNFDYDFKMILTYYLEKLDDKSEKEHTIILEKDDFIKRGDGYYRTKNPYSVNPLKEEYKLKSTFQKVMLLETPNNEDKYLGYGSYSHTTDIYGGNHLKSDLAHFTVRKFNRAIEKVVVDYEENLNENDKAKIVENIKKANPNINGNAVYSIRENRVEIFGVGREEAIVVPFEENIKRVKHTEVMTDMTMDDISDLENNIKTLQGRIEELEKNLKDKTNLNESLQNKVQQLEQEKTKLQEELNTLKTLLKEKIGNIADLKVDILELEKRIENLEKEVSSLQKENEKLNKEKSDLKTENDNLNNQLVAKDKLIQIKEDKVKELEKKIKELKEKASCCVNINEINEISKTIKNLENEIETLKEEIKKAKTDIPQNITVGMWYPETIMKFPTKRQYKDNENIDLSGMKIRFTKYIKENDEYKMIEEDVDYDVFKNEVYGWKFNLKTPKAIYNKDTNGKMQIKFSFVLKNKEKAMK